MYQDMTKEEKTEFKEKLFQQVNIGSLRATERQKVKFNVIFLSIIIACAIFLLLTITGVLGGDAFPIILPVVFILVFTIIFYRIFLKSVNEALDEFIKELSYGKLNYKEFKQIEKYHAL